MRIALALGYDACCINKLGYKRMTYSCQTCLYALNNHSMYLGSHTICVFSPTFLNLSANINDGVLFWLQALHSTGSKFF